MPILESTGITINPFYIPPFSLNEGEIAIIELPNGIYYSPLLFRLADLFSGKEMHPNVKFSTSFRYADYIKENFWQYRFSPLTVDKYIKKNGNPQSKLPQKIYEESWIKPSTKIRELPGNPRKFLTILTTFSNTNKIIFDLGAVDPFGGERIYQFVKDHIGKTGAAILIDHCGEFKFDCSVYVKFEVIGPLIKRQYRLERGKWTFHK